MDSLLESAERLQSLLEESEVEETVIDFVAYQGLLAARGDEALSESERARFVDAMETAISDLAVGLY